MTGFVDCPQCHHIICRHYRCRPCIAAEDFLQCRSSTFMQKVAVHRVDNLHVMRFGSLLD